MKALKIADISDTIRKRPLMIGAIAIPFAVVGGLIPIILEPRAYQAAELIQVSPTAAMTQNELKDMEVVLKNIRMETETSSFHKYMQGQPDATISVSSTSDPYQVNLVVRSSNPVSAVQVARKAGKYLSTSTAMIPNADSVNIVRAANAATTSGYTLRGNIERGIIGLLIGILLGIAFITRTVRKSVKA